MGARMGSMYRLKAYFGMVPAEELAEYADEPERYTPPARRTVRDYAAEHEPELRERETVLAVGRPVRRTTTTGTTPKSRGSAARPVPRSPSGPSSACPRRSPPAPRRPPRCAARWRSTPIPCGSRPRRASRSSASGRQAPRPSARITTLHPTSYNEARTIGERYRDGIPVIMNLTELDDASAKRLVDFAAGLVFALRGGFDKVTNRVFLLTPADVEVSADDARKLVSRVGSVGVERPRY